MSADTPGTCMDEIRTSIRREIQSTPTPDIVLKVWKYLDKMDMIYAKQTRQLPNLTGRYYLTRREAREDRASYGQHARLRNVTIMIGK